MPSFRARRLTPASLHTACTVTSLQACKLAALKQQQRHLPDGGKSVGISVGASMLVASVAGCVNVLLTNPICRWSIVEARVATLACLDAAAPCDDWQQVIGGRTLP